jgi:hypothetical protein
MIRNTFRGATVYGIHLGKNIFHVVGTDPAGNVADSAPLRFLTRVRRAPLA